jgi:hypothetical protein
VKKVMGLDEWKLKQERGELRDTEGIGRTNVEK